METCAVSGCPNVPMSQRWAPSSYDGRFSAVRAIAVAVDPTATASRTHPQSPGARPCVASQASSQLPSGQTIRSGAERSPPTTEPDIPNKDPTLVCFQPRLFMGFHLWEVAAADGANSIQTEAGTKRYCRCSDSEATPAATLRPVWPETDSGCSAIERPEPPTSTFAPTPTMAVASAVAPP